MKPTVLIQAYKQLMDAERKQKALDKMASKPMNYGILRDLINTASYGVTVDVTFSDGTKLTMRREEPFDRLKNTYREDF